MYQNISIELKDLLSEVRSCRACVDELPLGANPVVQATSSARVLIVGQAPGTRVHATGIPWNDASGDRLREWMGVDRDTFYDESRVAILPMGFCYPGRGKSGDLPPRSECAELWHDRILNQLPNLKLTLLVGSYAQQRYLHDEASSLTERVRNWPLFQPDYLPLVHPSPRNHLWLRRNPWFEQEMVPLLRSRVRAAL